MSKKVFIGLRQRIFEIIGKIHSKYIFKLILIQSTRNYPDIFNWIFVLIHTQCLSKIFDVIDMNPVFNTFSTRIYTIAV